MEEISAISTIIGSIGFPAFMCFYIIRTLNKSLENMNFQLHQLDKSIQKLIAETHFYHYNAYNNPKGVNQNGISIYESGRR